MPPKEPATVQTAIRIPPEWVPRLQAVADALSRPGVPLTPSDAMRAAIAEGLTVLEAQLQIASKGTEGVTPKARRPAAGAVGRK
jgi:predicted DNA-binding protein